MTWFKVDDKFWSHPKVMFTSTKSSGVWVRAGAWSSMHLTDGYIPARVLRAIIPEPGTRTDALALELVAAGLWVEAEDGWQFHQWTDHQPTREKVEADRANARARMQRVRGSGGSQVVRANFGGTSDGVRDSRPVPTRPDHEERAPKGERSSSGDPDPTPCEHGSDSPAKCAICRIQKNGARA